MIMTVYLAVLRVGSKSFFTSCMVPTLTHSLTHSLTVSHTIRYVRPSCMRPCLSSQQGFLPINIEPAYASSAPDSPLRHCQVICHPTHFCHSCVADVNQIFKMVQLTVVLQQGSEVRHRLPCDHSAQHCESDYNLCAHDSVDWGGWWGGRAGDLN